MADADNLAVQPGDPISLINNLALSKSKGCVVCQAELLREISNTMLGKLGNFTDVFRCSLKTRATCIEFSVSRCSADGECCPS